MAGPTEGGGPEGQDDREVTPPPLTEEQIEGHVSTLRSLIKDHNRKNKTNPIQLDFDEWDIATKDTQYKMPTNIKLYDGTTDPEDHLGRFASAANSGEWPMPVWCRMFQQTLDGPARGSFERLPANNIDEWADLREAFTTIYIRSRKHVSRNHTR
nr:reverse transcriptase domain-containing protein [Tanacetum cinerariifolium]